MDDPPPGRSNSKPPPSLKDPALEDRAAILQGEDDPVVPADVVGHPRQRQVHAPATGLGARCRARLHAGLHQIHDGSRPR